MAHFQDGQIHCHIVACSKPVPFLVLQVLLVNEGEQLGVEGAQMANNEGTAPEAVLIDGVVHVGARISDAPLHCDKVGVGNP